MVFAGGDGTEQNPYQITTLAQLDEVKNDLTAHYMLMNDIDASDTVNWINIELGLIGFVPIGCSSLDVYFSGCFDGNGHSVKNIYIESSNVWDLSLFGVTSSIAKIRNLGLIDPITRGLGTGEIGSLVGWNEGLVENCYTAGGTAFGTWAVASFIAYNSGGIIRNCYSINCDVQGEESSGFVTFSNDNAQIINCYTSCTTQSSDYYNTGFIRWSDSSNGVTNCYFDIDYSDLNIDDSFLGTGLTTTEMKTQSSYTNWDFENTWIMINDDYPTLRVFNELQNPPSTAPIITIANITTTKISDEIGKDICTVTFTTDQDIVEWEARADGNGAGQGDLVGSGIGPITVGTEITFDIENEELTFGNKTYRINIYGQNEQGVWSEYE
ncbi:MAG: hypothetical protein ACOWWO_11915 [Peptococcaceae bacterium]